MRSIVFPFARGAVRPVVLFSAALLTLGLAACGRMDLTTARETLYAREGQTFETHCRLADDGRNCQDTSDNPGAVVPLLQPASYGLQQALRKSDDIRFQMGLNPSVNTLNALARQVTIVSQRIEAPANPADGRTLIFLWTYNPPH